GRIRRRDRLATHTPARTTLAVRPAPHPTVPMSVFSFGGAGFGGAGGTVGAGAGLGGGGGGMSARAADAPSNTTANSSTRFMANTRGEQRDGVIVPVEARRV